VSSLAPLCLGIGDAERQGVEADLPIALFGFFDADDFAGETVETPSSLSLRPQ
jgi:hypothetical protein